MASNTLPLGISTPISPLTLPQGFWPSWIWKCLALGKTLLAVTCCVRLHIACVASVSNRVIARKLEQKQKKKGSFFPLPLSRHSFFFRSCPSFLDEPREETLATQASLHTLLVVVAQSLKLIKLPTVLEVTGSVDCT